MYVVCTQWMLSKCLVDDMNSHHRRIDRGRTLDASGPPSRWTKQQFLEGFKMKDTNLHVSGILLKKLGWGDLQDGREVRRGDHLPPHKYIRNTSTCGTNPTEHLLNAGRRPQTSQKMPSGDLHKEAGPNPKLNPRSCANKEEKGKFLPAASGAVD